MIKLKRKSPLGKTIGIIVFSAVLGTSAIINAQESKNFSAPKFKREMVPEVIYDNNKGFVELYYKAWELAFKKKKSQAGIPQSPYMDEALWDSDIWIWDTAFMTFFCKYAPDYFPGIESLDNFYCPMYDNYKSKVRIHILDNPPLFAWAEYEYFKFTNNKKRIDNLLLKKQYLQKHFAWFDSVKPGFKLPHSPTGAVVRLRKVTDGYYWEGGRSGMDNTPRGRRGKKAQRSRPNNPDMLWVDAIAQQGLSALMIAKLATAIDQKQLANNYQKKYQLIKNKVNSLYWDKQDGIYYDVNDKTKKFMKCLTPASFWPMLAQIPNKKQAQEMTQIIKNPMLLGGLVPWTTVARNDADFVASNGNYWRGSVWLPTAYMGIKALEQYGYEKLADQTASTILEHMLKTYKQYTPHTIWECYNPNKPEPAYHGKKRVKEDFCGWSALGPISLFIENYLGFYDVNAQTNTVKWRKYRKGRHGIKQLKFGRIVTDIIAENNNQIYVESNLPYTLVINKEKFDIKSGKQNINLKK